jgi:alanine-alpha-ketoisovalerate/valine-pyruvate aminotransferase
MATRSAIGYKLPTGEVRGIYCHWDGYVENNGKILQEHYQAAYKIAQMVELGDMSSLAAEIADCVYYGRDRNESDVATQTYTDIDDYVTHYADGCEYMYLWNGNEWIVTQGNLVFDRVEDLLELEAA